MDRRPDLRGIKPGSHTVPEPLDPLAPPPLDRYCDLVLKGGVVDGVIYPGALHELARHYRFQSIAGTSVGAIAASLAAACEFSRRFGRDAGFNEVLRPLADELAKTIESGSDMTKLRSLFQTSPEHRRLFGLAVDTLSVPWPQMRGRLWRGALRAYSTPALGAALAGSLLGFGASRLDGGGLHTLSQTILTLILICLGGAAGLGWALWRDVRRLACADGFGFCSGMSADGGATDGLTEWLHKGIQAAASLPLDRPLTFRDLWSAPGGPPGVPRSIDLRMITTAVSHGRPYEFPHDPRSTRLFFRMSELRAYFPASILHHLESVAEPYTRQDCVPSQNPAQPSGYKTSPKVPGPGEEPYWELPHADLPVLVATRLSMNFPVLFKSVPLHAIDEERGHVDGDAPRFKKAWFSDGGICANFPVHFFDSPLPAWPTFGIFIAGRTRDHRYAGDGDGDSDDPPERKGPRAPEPRLWTWLPKFHTTGKAEKWLDVPDAGQPHALLRYLMAIASTAKDWADHASLRTPGVRDRVVYVYKNDDTNGGLNLKLGANAILQLAYGAGVEAGRSLAYKFLLDPRRQNPALQGTPGWLDHRWMRLNAYLNALREHLAGFSESVHGVQEASPLPEQIRQAAHVPPLYFEYFVEPTLSAAQANALQNAITAIAALEAQLAQRPVAQPYEPSPQPHLASRPGI